MKRLFFLMAIIMASFGLKAQTEVVVDSALSVEIFDGVFSDYIIKTYSNHHLSYALTGMGLFRISDSAQILSQLQTEHLRLQNKVNKDSTELAEVSRRLIFYTSMKREFDSIWNSR